MYVDFHVKSLSFLANIIQNWEVLTNFSEGPQYKISQKSSWWSFHVVSQMGMTKLTVTFCNCFANAPENANQNVTCIP